VNDSRQRWGSYIAAGLLASLTIRVFFELQDFGPESAIRTFMNALRDPHSIQGEVITDPISGDPQKLMLVRLVNWQRHGVEAQVGYVKQSGNEARATVIFSFPNGTIWTTVWVVERRGKSWLVDANKTATIFWDDLPPYIVPVH